FLHDRKALEGVAQRHCREGMIQAPSVVSLERLREAIAPPREKLLFRRNEVATNVDQSPGFQQRRDALRLHGRMADGAQLSLVVPDIILQGGDIEVAEQQHPSAPGMDSRPVRHLLKEGKLVGELVIDFGVGRGAAGGDVEVMYLKR